MADIAIFRINYKSDFILTLNSDAGWMTPFCIKFWTGAPSQAYFVGYDGTTYTHCAPVAGEPTKLLVQFDDHHLPIGDLKFQIAYHFTVADFPTSVEDEVLNQASVIIEVDDAPAQVMLDLNGETAPELQFTLPAYTNEQQRIANEEQRIAAEAIRIENEESRIAAETIRQQNEAQRIANEEARISEYAQMKADAIEATAAANFAANLANEKAQMAADKAALANEKAQLAADKAALAQSAATLATEKAQLADDKAALAQSAATLANDKAALAQQKAEYATAQGDYAKAQGDYAKAQADVIPVDVTRTQTDATFVNGNHDSLFYLRQATPSLAGLMTAAEHNKLNDMPSAQEVNAGIAYDVSVLHPTSGVNGGNTYASLSAALAVIPQNKHKGGMTVKFVLSSDNKYVQYRYMGTVVTGTPNPFLDTANWDKYNNVSVSQNTETGHIDISVGSVTTPVASIDEITNLDELINGREQNYTSGYYITSEGVVNPSASAFITDFIPVSKNDYVHAENGYQYGNVYASDKETVLQTESFTGVRQVTADGAAFIRVGCLNSNFDSFNVEVNSFVVYSPQNEIVGALTDIETLKTEMETKADEDVVSNLGVSVNQLNLDVNGQKQTWETGYIQIDGTVADSNIAGHSDYIPVNNGDSIVFANGYQYICLYDSNKLLLDYWGAKSPTRTFTISNANAAYIRGGFLKTSFANAYISVNDVKVFVPLNYIPSIDDKINSVSNDLKPVSQNVARMLETDKYTYHRYFDGANIIVSADYILSPYIDISQHRSLYVFPNGTQTLYWHSYDENKEFLDAYSVASGEYSTKNLPSTAYYIRVCYRIDRADDVSVKDLITGEVLWTPFYYWKNALQSGDVISLHPQKEMYSILKNLKYDVDPITSHPYGDTPLTLLFFSDIHGCSVPLSRIMRFANEYSPYLDAVCAGGDNVNRAADNYNFWPIDGAQRVLPVIGNHELLATEGVPPEIGGVPVAEGQLCYSAKYMYDKEFAPFLSETQFTEIVTNKCYWYKDFPNSKIRVIGIDDYHWKESPIRLSNDTYAYEYPDGESFDTGQQLTWFESVLAGAKTAEYSVIVIHHAPAQFNEPIKCPFTSYDFHNYVATDPTNPSGKAYTKEPFEAVQNFIDTGGKFVCWLSGHLHQDAVGVVKGYTGQFQLTIDTTRYGNDSEGRNLSGGLGSNYHFPNTMSADCFDLIKVDTYFKLISIFRIGSNIDRYGRHLGCFVWDYENNTMISCD